MMNERCGNCCAFEVKNVDEAELAQISLGEGQCRPGDSKDPAFGRQKLGCHGGHVRGACRKWRERGAHHPQVESGFWCRLWGPGGPVIRGMPPACAPTGSPNRPPAPSTSKGGLGIMALFAVVTVTILDRIRGKGS